MHYLFLIRLVTFVAKQAYFEIIMEFKLAMLADA